MTSRLMCGVSKIDITPPLGVGLAGMGKGHHARSVHDPLCAVALVFSDGETAAALVTADLLGMDVEITTRVKELVAAEINPGHVVITASHTHYGPNTRFILPYPEKSPEYLEQLISGIADGIRTALAGLKEAVVGVGRGAIRKNVNRRVVLPDGTARFLYDDEPGLLSQARGPVDDEVGVVHIREIGGAPMATLVHYTCHPICLPVDTEFISADYPGVAKRAIEQEIGGVALFANGACGNIGPIGALTGFERAEEIGQALARETRRVTDTMDFSPEGRVGVATGVIDLPVRPGIADSWDMHARVRGVRRVRAELKAVRLNDCVFVGIPGESFVELALELKRRSPFGHTYVLYVANDDLMYIPTPDAYPQGLYEVSVALVDAPAYDIIVNEAARLIELLYREK